MAVQNADRAYKFVMEFIAASDQYKQQYVERWREVLANFMVDPMYGEGSYASPYGKTKVYRTRARQVILKDPETHKAIMTYASKLVRSLLSSRDREYIKAKPRGYEDAAQKSPTVSRLLRYDFALPGVFRSFVESIIDMLLFGTSVLEVGWEYCEREMPVRTVFSEQGIDYDETSRMKIPIYDDVKISPVDVVDFYPDPSRYRIQDMPGAAKRFKMNALEARNKGVSGVYDQGQVEKAINDLSNKTSPIKEQNFRAGIDQPQQNVSHSDFKDMIGYEYWGDVPW